ncbi:MAG: PAS-domain containing protein [Proteobacteria bacterium]|nr:PAS-domain containing protein [Pseudomonadota bacterium]
MAWLTTSRRILGCAVALAVALLGLTVWTVIQAREIALEQAAVDSQNLARTLQQHTLQAFQSVDLVLRGLADRPGPTDAPALSDVLARHAQGLGQVRELVVLDARGTPIASSAGLGSPAPSAATSDYFTAQRDRADRGLFIGLPARGPADGRWSVALSRRISAPDGSFAGIVMAALQPGYFQDFYDRVEIGPHGGIALFGMDGTLYFRKPYDDSIVGRNVSQQPNFQNRLLRYPAGTFETTPSIDGILRISSHRQIEAYPFVIVAGLAKADVLGPWRFRSAIDLSVASVLALTMLGLAGLFDREFRKRAGAEADARLSASRFEQDKVILEAVLRALPDGILLLDADGGLLLWNDLVFDVLDLERATVVDAADPTTAFWTALEGRSDTATYIRGMTAAPTGSSIQEMQLATGKWIEARVTNVRGLGYVAICRDIAERKHRELEMEESQMRLQKQATTLAQLAEDLDMARQTAEAARIEAETASRTKSNFITGMNHELRTPLNAILGFAQVIREQRFGDGALDRYSEYADHIISSGEHLLSLINDLLDLAKIEAGKMDMQPQPVDVRQLLSSALLMVRETATSGGVAVRLEAPDEPIVVSGDARRLKQCFLNLISNAVKFTPAGGRVVITVTPGRNTVEIAVADTGIGVKASDIAKIFEPFGQVDSMLGRRHAGSGLGLPLARSLVELHGGDLSFRSVEGAGTTVTVSLPRERLVA